MSTAVMETHLLVTHHPLKSRVLVSHSYIVWIIYIKFHSLSVIPSSLLPADLNVSYGIGEYSVRLQWQLSSDEDVDNYTLTLYNSEQIIEILHTIIRSIELNLTYAISYSVEVYGRYCAGTGNTSVYEGIYYNYHACCHNNSPFL